MNLRWVFLPFGMGSSSPGRKVGVLWVSFDMKIAWEKKGGFLKPKQEERFFFLVWFF
jgi:hypothetical protein